MEEDLLRGHSMQGKLGVKLPVSRRSLLGDGGRFQIVIEAAPSCPCWLPSAGLRSGR